MPKPCPRSRSSSTGQELGARSRAGEQAGSSPILPNGRPPSERFRVTFLAWAFEFGKAAAVLLVTSLLVHLFILTLFFVRGASMLPSFKDGQLLAVERISLRFGAPSRGDVVVLRFPGREAEWFIKRIIGLPGERLSIKDGKVSIDGRRLIEPYLEAGTRTEPASEVVLGLGEYYVLGDNRENSNDSRAWGPLPRKNIIGRPIFILWPKERFGPLAWTE